MSLRGIVSQFQSRPTGGTETRSTSTTSSTSSTGTTNNTLRNFWNRDSFDGRKTSEGSKPGLTPPSTSKTLSGLWDQFKNTKIGSMVDGFIRKVSSSMEGTKPLLPPPGETTPSGNTGIVGPNQTRF